VNRLLIHICIALSTLGVSASAAIELHPLFSDHAVLQREKSIPVWGRSNSGQTITVTLNGVTGDTFSSPEGNWRVRLPAMKAGGPYEMVVKDEESEVVVKDVYIGEVWLASGQSNMEFTVSRSIKKWAGTVNEEQEIASATHPKIRMITVPLKLADDAQDTFEGKWEVCSPESVPGFSAIGYFFARELNQRLDVPVGIISSAFGASCAQAWISREALEPSFQLQLDEYAQAVADFKSGAAQAKYEAALKEWDLAAEKASADGKPVPRMPGAPRNPQEDQHRPTLTYNAMIAPLRPYAMRGVIWYQGESNGWDHQEYLPLMQTLIADWRKKWDEEFPFLFVQLAAYKAPATHPVGNSQIASVREAQRLTLGTPNTAMACTIDIGDANDVHPHNKQEVGRRLALAARATVYGEKIEHSGPLLRSALINDEKIEIAFEHAEGLKIGRTNTTQPTDSETKLLGFSLLADGRWSWADAKIEGHKVVIPLQSGQTPTEVRYAWADYPICNLYNGADLPASPFRAELRRE
jgi:sialate O-acetylesterase